MKLNILTGTLVLLSALNSFAEETQTAAAAPTAAAATVAPSQGQSTAPASAAVPEAKKKAWKAAYNFRALYGRVDADNGTGKVSNRNRFTLGYNFGPAAVAIKPTWTNTHNVDSNTGKVTAGDLILEVSKGGIALNHGWTLGATGRYYLPTSESSRLLASNGMLFGDLLFTRPIGTRFTAVVEGTYTNTFQGHRTAYQARKAGSNKPVGKPSSKPTTNLPSDQIVTSEGNARYDVTHLVGLEYKINKSFAFTQTFSYANRYSYSEKSLGISSGSDDSFGVMSYFSYQAAKNVGIDFGLSQDRDNSARAAQPKYTYMADAETQYYLEASISL